LSCILELGNLGLLASASLLGRQAGLKPACIKAYRIRGVNTFGLINAWCFLYIMVPLVGNMLLHTHHVM
jgi:hypothetical protein